MLFRTKDLEAIMSGRVTTAFRRWKKPGAKAGSQQRTQLGMVAIDSVEEIDPTTLTEADAKAACAGDPHPQAGEAPRTEADRQQVDRLPAPGGCGRPLDLRQQAGRVPGPALRGETQLRLVEDLAVAPGAGDGVDGRGIEADDDQRRATP